MQRMNDPEVRYPYIPVGRGIKYVPADNKFMESAREICKTRSTDRNHPTGSVIARDGAVIGRGANQAAIRHSWAVAAHKKFCIRRMFGIKTGKSYWLCPGCASPKSHSEQRAIIDAKKHYGNIAGADLYLWGHWWCCESCWNAVIGAEICNVYLMDGSEHLFNKDNPDNAVGK
ncbi:MAG: deaminase [Candidatus Liptonbacteria bacterium]